MGNCSSEKLTTTVEPVDGVHQNLISDCDYSDGKTSKNYNNKKRSSLFKYQSIGSVVTMVSDDLAPLWSKLSRLSSIQAERTLMDKCFPSSAVKNSEVKIEKRSIKGVLVYRFTPEKLVVKPLIPTVFYYHGGGFTSSSVFKYVRNLTESAKLLNVQIISPEYRLAPENPFPAGLDDCLNTTKILLLNAEKNRIDVDNYAIMGDSAGADMAIWVAIELAKSRKSGEINFPAATIVCPIYPCVSSGIVFDYYPSIRSEKANKFLKPSFLSSRGLYLGGFDGHDPVCREIMRQNLNVNNKTRNSQDFVESMEWDALDFIKQVTDKFNIPIKPIDLKIGCELKDLDFEHDVFLKNQPLVKNNMKQILKIQDKFERCLPRILCTVEKIETVKEHGCENWLMVVAEHDHARDGGIVIGKRLEKHGVECETFLVKKAFHGFWTNSKLLGGFEAKDDKDVDNILSKIRRALSVQVDDDSKTEPFLSDFELIN